VRSSEIDRDWEEKKTKRFDLDRVITECAYDKNPHDRRIAYEMTGNRLVPEDWPDSTSESEEEEEGDDLSGINGSPPQTP